MPDLTSKLVNVETHILSQQMLHPGASGDFTGLLNDIAFSCKIIAKEVSRAGLVDILGATEQVNIQGETVQKLDDYSNDVMLKFVGRRGQVCMLASEEMDDPVYMTSKNGSDKYIVVFDPLDGSSNIDANVSIGTIFSIYKRVSRNGKPTDADLLQPGRDLVAAGYVIYGSSTMLVYTTGAGVHGFTLDPTIGEFLLSHPDIKTPFDSGTYSVNEGRYNGWSPAVKDIVNSFKTGRAGKDLKGLGARYIGSLVADFHRNLLYGGIFMYPASESAPDGKLRLLYEAAPLAMIVENAGGYASTGYMSISDVMPEELHQRTPLYIGSRNSVLWVEKQLSDKKKGI